MRIRQANAVLHNEAVHYYTNIMARPTGLEPVTYGLAYLLRLSPPLPACTRNVWGLDYIFTVSGGTRIVSTDPVY